MRAVSTRCTPSAAMRPVPAKSSVTSSSSQGRPLIHSMNKSCTLRRAGQREAVVRPRPHRPLAMHLPRKARWTEIDEAAHRIGEPPEVGVAVERKPFRRRRAVERQEARRAAHLFDDRHARADSACPPIENDRLLPDDRLVAAHAGDVRDAEPHHPPLRLAGRPVVRVEVQLTGGQAQLGVDVQRLRQLLRQPHQLDRRGQLMARLVEPRQPRRRQIDRSRIACLTQVAHDFRIGHLHARAIVMDVQRHAHPVQHQRLRQLRQRDLAPFAGEFPLNLELRDGSAIHGPGQPQQSMQRSVDTRRDFGTLLQQRRCQGERDAVEPGLDLAALPRPRLGMHRHRGVERAAPPAVAQRADDASLHGQRVVVKQP